MCSENYRYLRKLSTSEVLEGNYNKVGRTFVAFPVGVVSSFIIIIVVVIIIGIIAIIIAVVIVIVVITVINYFPFFIINIFIVVGNK